MKIGIITWFTGSNYGTNLQAIALQYYLRKQGHHVEIIHYEVEANDFVKRSFWKRVANQPEKYISKYAYRKYKKEIQARDRKLKEAIRKNCMLTEKITSEEQLIKVCNSFDLLICGSDQIWNPNWYHRFYFADYDAIQTPRISYAPSMGVNEIPELAKANIQRSIEKFAAVSVRERRGAELLQCYTKRPPVVVTDPTFLLSASEWNEIFPRQNKKKKEDYVLCMLLSDNYEHWKAVRSFARKKNLVLKILPYQGRSYLFKEEVCAGAGLEDMLELLRDAKYVFTDSFHITVFSIIYEKQFYTFQRFKDDNVLSQNTRIYNLLEMSGLEKRLIPFGSKKVLELEEIVYAKHKQKMKVEIRKSKEFLYQSINGKEKLKWNEK